MSAPDMVQVQHAVELAMLRMCMTNTLIRASVDDEEVHSISVSARHLPTGEVVCEVEHCGPAGFPVGGYSL